MMQFGDEVEWHDDCIVVDWVLREGLRRRRWKIKAVVDLRVFVRFDVIDVRHRSAFSAGCMGPEI